MTSGASERSSAPLPAEVTVAFLPDYTSRNPYLRLLETAISRAGGQVVFCSPQEVLSAESLPGDVVHLHWERAWLVKDGWREAVRWSVSLVRLFRRARQTGCGVVWTLHNLQDHESRHPYTEHFFQVILARLAHALVVHYPEAVPVARRWTCSPRKQVVVAPIGSYAEAHGPPRSRPAARGRLGIPDEVTVFVALGAVRRYKRLPQLIREFHHLTDPRLRLVVAGWPGRDGAAEAVRAAAARDARVIARTEMLNDDDYNDYLAAADVFVLSSERQFTSSSVVVAMDHALPIVAADLPHIRYLCGDAGAVYFDPDVDGDLAIALRSVLERDRDAMGEENLRRAREMSWDDAGRTLMSLYRDITSRRRPRPASSTLPQD